MDTCSSNNTTFPLCTFNNSCKRSLRQRRENQTILLKAILNHSNFQNIPCICQSSRREQQSRTRHTECESKRDVNVDHQGSGSAAKKSKNAAKEYLNHSCLVAMMEDQNDCINISLQLKSYVEYPMCMTKIIWLSMIPVVFVFTISTVIYKIVQENEQN
ncbi:TM156 protein, partial [Corythaeola cristata]|nr:TM156 protein [Corythaeola cristata]